MREEYPGGHEGVRTIFMTEDFLRSGRFVRRLSASADIEECRCQYKYCRDMTGFNPRGFTHMSNQIIAGS